MKAAIQFSGGIDSIACLLVKRGMPNCTVYWTKTDGAYPEMEEHVRRCCDELGFPLEIIESDREIGRYGYPDDTNVATVFECCARGLWIPMHERMKADGIEMIIRGQRKDDFLKSPIRDGHVEDGITYHLPIETWTRDEVIAFVEDRAPHLIPDGYRLGELTGRDCWDCTGYLFDNARRILNLPEDKKLFVIQMINETTTKNQHRQEA